MTNYRSFSQISLTNDFKCGFTDQMMLWFTRATLYAEIPLAFWISIHAEGWDWNNQDREAVFVYKYVQRMETVKQLGPWSSPVSHSYYYIYSSGWVFTLVAGGKTGIMKFWPLKWNLILEIKISQNNRDLNQGILHLWSKFGDPSLNRWWVMALTSLGLMQAHTPTNRPRQRQYPKAKSGLR